MDVALYWLARTAIFLAVYFTFVLLHWFDLFAVVVAFIVAWVLSFLALPGMRRKAALQVDAWLKGLRRGIESDERAEDSAVESLERDAQTLERGAQTLESDADREE